VEREDGIEAAKSEAVSCIGDVGAVVEAKDIGGEGAEPGEDAGIDADAAGVLGEGDVADVVRAVFDVPVVADGGGADVNRTQRVADVVGGFAGLVPQAAGGVMALDTAADADDGGEMRRPLGVGEAITWVEHLGDAAFEAGASAGVCHADPLRGGRAAAEVGDGQVKGGLVVLDLGDQMSAGAGGLLESFF
jgi:hypothetical protein